MCFLELFWSSLSFRIWGCLALDSDQFEDFLVVHDYQFLVVLLIVVFIVFSVVGFFMVLEIGTDLYSLSVFIQIWVIFLVRK